MKFTHTHTQVYTRFKAFLAPYWGVSPSTYFRIVGYSRSGASRYVEMNGHVRLVPTACLTYSG